MTLSSNILKNTLNNTLTTEGSMPLRHAPLPMSPIVEPASSLLAFGGKAFGGGSGAANVPKPLPKGQKILAFPGSENQIHQMTKGQFQKLTGKLPASMPVQRFVGNDRLISPHNAQLYQQGMWLFAVPTGLPAQSVSNRTYVSLAPDMKGALVELTHRAVMARYPSGVSASEAASSPVVGQYFSMYDYQQLWELQTRLNRGEGGPIGRQYQNMLGKLEKAYVQLVNEVVHRQSPATRIATGPGQSAVGAATSAPVSSPAEPALHPTISMEEAFPLPSATPQGSVASATVNPAPPISRQAAIEHVLGDTQGLYRLGLQQALLLRVQGMSGPQILAYNRDLLNSPVTVDAIHTEARQWLRQQAISAIVQQVKSLDSNLSTESVSATVEQSLSDRGISGWQAITQFAKDLSSSPQVLQSLVNQTRGLSTQATPGQPVASRSIPSTLGSTPTTSTPISGATQIQATQSLGYKDVIGATQKINTGSAANLTLTPMQQGGTQFFVGQVTVNGKTHTKVFNTHSKAQATEQAQAWVNTITEELLEKVLQPHKDAIQEVETAERRDWNFRHTQSSPPRHLSPEAEAIAKAKNSNAGNGPIQRDRVVADASAAELAWNQWQKKNPSAAINLLRRLQDSTFTNSSEKKNIYTAIIEYAHNNNIDTSKVADHYFATRWLTTQNPNDALAQFSEAIPELIEIIERVHYDDSDIGINTIIEAIQHGQEISKLLTLGVYQQDGSYDFSAIPENTSNTLQTVSPFGADSDEQILQVITNLAKQDNRKVLDLAKATKANPYTLAYALNLYNLFTEYVLTKPFSKRTVGLQIHNKIIEIQYLTQSLEGLLQFGETLSSESPELTTIGNPSTAENETTTEDHNTGNSQAESTGITTEDPKAQEILDAITSYKQILGKHIDPKLLSLLDEIERALQTTYEGSNTLVSLQEIAQQGALNFGIKIPVAIANTLELATPLVFTASDIDRLQNTIDALSQSELTESEGFLINAISNYITNTLRTRSHQHTFTEVRSWIIDNIVSSLEMSGITATVSPSILATIEPPSGVERAVREYFQNQPENIDDLTQLISFAKASEKLTNTRGSQKDLVNNLSELDPQNSDIITAISNLAIALHISENPAADIKRLITSTYQEIENSYAGPEDIRTIHQIMTAIFIGRESAEETN